MLLSLLQMEYSLLVVRIILRGRLDFFLFFNQDGDENENMKKYKDLAKKKKLFDLQFRNIFTMNIL